MAAKRATMATVKAFIRKNRDRLLIRNRAGFDGMSDGMEWNCGAPFEPIKAAEQTCENNMGIAGAWIVGGSRNCVTAFDNGTHVGFEIYNCCRVFVLAVAK